ncbi:MAG TPA: ACT domain-containing protein [Paludibacteraceae bacterium]|jgi:hypothetical protein|nr:ACT domain-containing protein [Paludibacteraceae bacterium]OPZ01379.1 MAG: acetolactate synthase 3 regulatory subunit [Bacteroidetes bacterium ADurb.BinA395]HOF98933.1 ACT domain-containing protein [Paludibacteraceae bacterium]HOJ66307.1 ACT domain-containing protein [Paludibacteraceae bacterium]HOL29742.1 ACT domain-containing protein [Paludibacteraceae bacterium]
MKIRQLSVFVENKTGHLNQILAVLARNNINIIALTLADSIDFGLLRMLVSDAEKAAEALRTENFTVRIHEVLSLELEGVPGSLSRVLNHFSDNGIAIEYIYAFSFGSKSILVMRPDNTEKAIEIIQKYQLKPIYESDLKAQL